MALTAGSIVTDTVHAQGILVGSAFVGFSDAILHIMDCTAIADADTITIPGCIACASKNSTGDLAAVLSNVGATNATVTFAAIADAANVCELFYFTKLDLTAPSSANVTIANASDGEQYAQNLSGCQLLIIPVSDTGALSTTYDPGVSNIAEVAWEPTDASDEVTVSVSDGNTVSLDSGTDNAAGNLWVWYGSGDLAN